ncbi:MAG: hypothetical protein OJF49_001188 [Ktedonobacterales bacterium]|jgi:tetratricopeptide (TPR) repeat protein/transcriptional regulator with XRE-family HTH domain|nr:MAG: hypothetical protein OJF49_001188 [Ktedonobacterales bacterium]
MTSKGTHPEVARRQTRTTTVRTTPNLYLRQARAEQCLSQDELAERLGTTQVTISRWERGLTRPSPYYRRKLCEVFDLTPAALGLVADEHEEGDLAGEGRDATVSVAALPRIHEPTMLIPPLSPYGLVGREALVETLARRLCDLLPGAAYALYGLPGAGKTALAIMLARHPEILERFPDGVLWAGVGHMPNIPGLLASWGTRLGMTAMEMRQFTRADHWARAIHAAIGERRMLMVVDDVWSVRDAVAFKVGGPGCGHLITTRFAAIALELGGENSSAVRELSQEAGIELLERLAPQVVASAPGEALHLVQSVGGLPLAITLLGRYLRVQSHGGQQRRLRAAFERLRDAEERLRLAAIFSPVEQSPNWLASTPISLQAAIEVSEQHLTATASRALHALAVFPPKPSSFSEEAALAVCVANAEETLDVLLDADLLESAGSGRYMLHQTIADYARLGLGEGIVRERMVMFYCAYVERHLSDYAALDQESANVLAALELAHTERMAETLVRYVCLVAPFLLARGLYAIAETHLRRAHDAAVELCDDVRLAQIWMYLGYVAELRGDLAQAESLYETGIQVARRTAQSETLCALLARRGEAIIARGHYLEAEPYLVEGIALARNLGDHQRLGVLIRLLGEVADCGGASVRGDALYLDALHHAQAVHDDENISALLQNLGAKAVQRGDYAEADGYYAEGLMHARAIGHRQRMSALLNNMGALACLRKRYEEAETLCGESLNLARAIGHPVRTNNALQNLGVVARERGAYKEAERYLGEALAIAREIPHVFLISETLYEWSQIYARQRQFERASMMLGEALALAEEVGAQEVMSQIHYGLARVAAATGDLAEALRQGQRSLEMFDAMQHEQSGTVSEWLDALRREMHAQRSASLPSSW